MFFKQISCFRAFKLSIFISNITMDFHDLKFLILFCLVAFIRRNKNLYSLINWHLLRQNQNIQFKCSCIFLNQILVSYKYLLQYFYFQWIWNFFSTMFNSRIIKVCYILSIQMQINPMNFSWLIRIKIYLLYFI